MLQDRSLECRKRNVRYVDAVGAACLAFAEACLPCLALELGRPVAVRPPAAGPGTENF